MNLIKNYYALDKTTRQKISIIITFVASILWSSVKLIFGFIENSVFLIASSIFTGCLAISKLLCLIGIIKHKKEYKVTHIISSIMIILSGMAYCIYNIRLLMDNSIPNYGLIPSIAIAAVSFFLFVKAIVFLFKDRINDDYNRNLRVIAVISGAMDIVLTQMCLLAVEMPQMNQRYNSYLALGLSTITCMLGLYCLIKPIIEKNKNDEEAKEDLT